MKRPPWEITREMFLAEEELDDLLGFVRGVAARETGRRLASAQLDEFIIESLVFSGLRTSEFCRLAVGDTIIGQREPVFRVRGPGEEARTIHIPQRVSDLVVRFVESARPTFLPDDADPYDPDRPLLYSERRQPYERTGLYRRVKRILTEAGLGARASVQLLRHTYVYLAYRYTGGNLLFVQRQLGHAHPMVTAVYERLVEEHYDEMADRIDTSLFDAAPGRTITGGFS